MSGIVIRIFTMHRGIDDIFLCFVMFVLRGQVGVKPNKAVYTAVQTQITSINQSNSGISIQLLDKGWIFGLTDKHFAYPPPLMILGCDGDEFFA